MTYSGRDVLSGFVDMPPYAGDGQWASSSEAVSNTFYYAPGSRRVVNAVRNAVSGQRLCKYGRTTGATCDDVRSLSSCRGDYCNLVMMQNRLASGGDSGGPWYWGNTAYGLHSGYTTSLFQKRGQFTPMSRVLSSLLLSMRY